MIAVRLLNLKLELKYRKNLKLYKDHIDSWLNELKLELNNAKKNSNEVKIVLVDVISMHFISIDWKEISASLGIYIISC